VLTVLKMSADSTDFTAKSFFQDCYLAQKANHPLHDPSFRYNAPSSSLLNSAKSFVDLNVSADRSVSRWSPEPPATTAAGTKSPPSTQSARSDAWCEAVAEEHEPAKLPPETEQSSTEKNQTTFSQSYRKAFFIGLSLGSLFSGIALAIVLSLWLNHLG
jgi:hypothetical protein